MILHPHGDSEGQMIPFLFVSSICTATSLSVCGEQYLIGWSSRRVSRCSAVCISFGFLGFAANTFLCFSSMECNASLWTGVRVVVELQMTINSSRYLDCACPLCSEVPTSFQWSSNLIRRPFTSKQASRNLLKNLKNSHQYRRPYVCI